MEIEVGKAYRTRDGKKVTLIGYDVDSSYSFMGDNEQYYTPSGFFRIDKIEHKYDLIAEWVEPVKYRAGDHVTIKMSDTDAYFLNDQNASIGSKWGNSEIISHTPAPFDWADVKPGMAFQKIGKDYYGYFIGFDKDGDPVLDFLHVWSCGGAAYQCVPKHLLKPAPEHDIEVKS